ncbi:MAG: tetratricopeptide repeat protein [Chitinophagia bacterium]|nr:tetratricopeptide repeat protein [Chitinophagia bacterium]
MTLNIPSLLTQAYNAFQSGQLEIAENLTTNVIRIQSGNFDALFLNGIIQGLKGHHAAAAKHLKKAVYLAPQHPYAQYNLAKALIELGRHKEAVEHLKKSITLEPNNPESELNLGLCLMKEGLFDSALKHLERALNLNPRHIETMVNCAICHIELGNIAYALETALLTTSLSPNNDACWSVLGAAHLKNNNLTNAITCYQKAIALDNNNYKYYLSIGKCYKQNNDINNAIEAYEAALKLSPTNIDCLNSLATILIRQQKFENAEHILKKAIDSDPNNSDTHVNLSILHFLKFELDLGWNEYEFRDKNKYLYGGSFQSSKRQWDPKYTNDRLLIWGEQGIGDQIIYASMLNDISKIVSRLRVGVDDRLINLLGRSFPTLDLTSIKDRPANSTFDSYLPIASLGRYFRNQVTDFPTPKPFLKADYDKISAFKAQTHKGKLICGISWKSKNNTVAESKSMLASDLMPLFKLNGAHFFNLQYLPEQEDLELFFQQKAPIQSFNDLDTFNDIDGLAAAIMACDVVVTVSNTTAHLSGALGKETLLLLSHSVGKFWYWNEYQGRNLWYPNIKVFQQKIEGDWSYPLAELQKYLEQKIA